MTTGCIWRLELIDIDHEWRETKWLSDRRLKQHIEATNYKCRDKLVQWEVFDCRNIVFCNLGNRIVLNDERLKFCIGLSESDVDLFDRKLHVYDPYKSIRVIYHEFQTGSRCNSVSEPLPHEHLLACNGHYCTIYVNPSLSGFRSKRLCSQIGSGAWHCARTPEKLSITVVSLAAWRNLRRVYGSGRAINWWRLRRCWWNKNTTETKEVNNNQKVAGRSMFDAVVRG